ncbi:bifunctional DNA primase/polymerase [Streptomyces sp. NPDC058525]|uniref:bifunctional DNA primase/polymerase n=1 Tax=Streptomyces sp. NPDC058525 TaxID=3346538 RepID=UPI003656B5E1
MESADDQHAQAGAQPLMQVYPDHPKTKQSLSAECARLGDSAERLQRLGLYLFPADHPYLPEPACLRMHHPEQIRTERAKGTAHQRGKHPSMKWSLAASNDPAAAARWYAGTPRNIGIACAPSGLLVLDDDTGTALADLCADHDHDMPETFTVSTRAGRRHHYFLQPDPEAPLGNGLGALAGRGFDIRGGVTATSEHGGYVIAPGSRHETNAVYTAFDWAAEIVPLPGWIELLLRVAPESQAAGQSRCTWERIRGVVADLLAQAEGNRDNHLWWSACRFAEAVADGADEAALRAVLASAAERIGLTAWDAETKLTRALRAVAA